MCTSKEHSFQAPTTMAAAFYRLAFVCLLCSLVLSIQVPSSSSLSFNFNFSNTVDPCGQQLVCMGDAYFADSMIELTRNDITRNMTLSKGRVWYPAPVPLWDGISGELTSFTTAFSFKITPDPENKNWGDGMAFFLARYSNDSNVLASNSAPGDGGYLGLFNEGNRFNATGDGRVVAVEFDTFRNSHWDNSSQHVGIDVNSIMSVATVDLRSEEIKNFRCNCTMTAMIHYENTTKLLIVDLQINDTMYRVSETVDFKLSLPEQVAVGFSAATGTASELHRILPWSFTSTLEKTDLPAPPVQIQSKPSANFLFKVLIPILAVFVCAIMGLLLWLRWKPRIIEEPNEGGNNRETQVVEFERQLTRPRRYRYRELTTATDNFARENMLGEGGFGTVYRGTLSNGTHVAIKKFSSRSHLARTTFEAEVRTLSQLRHRNLVQLLGWCASHEEGPLLVYELVPGGNLDVLIHGTQRESFDDVPIHGTEAERMPLTWSDRYNIILGLGSALRYLHHESGRGIVHGDIKPSNILLDATQNAKLADFGLARLVEHGTRPQTTENVLGTPGYLDPAFIHTRRPSFASDIYSFGIVLLEIVSGKRPVGQEPPLELLSYVWGLHRQGTIINAADERLRCNDADRRQMKRALMVGLWCAHHELAQRPSAIGEAMLVLESEDSNPPTPSPSRFVTAESSASGSSSRVVRSSASTGTTGSLE